MDLKAIVLIFVFCVFVVEHCSRLPLFHWTTPAATTCGANTNNLWRKNQH
jgi:hypothetical protein